MRSNVCQGQQHCQGVYTEMIDLGCRLAKVSLHNVAEAPLHTMTGVRTESDHADLDIGILNDAVLAAHACRSVRA